MMFLFSTREKQVGDKSKIRSGLAIAIFFPCDGTFVWGWIQPKKWRNGTLTVFSLFFDPPPRVLVLECSSVESNSSTDFWPFFSLSSLSPSALFRWRPLRRGVSVLFFHFLLLRGRCRMFRFVSAVLFFRWCVFFLFLFFFFLEIQCSHFSCLMGPGDRNAVVGSGRVIFEFI